MEISTKNIGLPPNEKRKHLEINVPKKFLLREKSYKYVKKYIRRWKMFEISSNKHYNLNIKIKVGKSDEKQMVKTMCCSYDVICFCWNVRF